MGIQSDDRLIETSRSQPNENWASPMSLPPAPSPFQIGSVNTLMHQRFGHQVPNACNAKCNKHKAIRAHDVQCDIFRFFENFPKLGPTGEPHFAVAQTQMLDSGARAVSCFLAASPVYGAAGEHDHSNDRRCIAAKWQEAIRGAVRPPLSGKRGVVLYCLPYRVGRRIPLCPSLFANLFPTGVYRP